MSVTTVLHPVQPPSIGSLNHKSPMNHPRSSTGTLDKFPTVDDDSLTVTGDANGSLPSSNPRYSPEPPWLPRKNGVIPHGLPNTRKQRPPRKSISEAIGSFKKRSASVSVNAQELAEALKAPVSYRLVVSEVFDVPMNALSLSLPDLRFL